MTRPAPITFTTLDQVPERVASMASMEWNRTGSWRYMKPLYVNKTPPCNHGCPAGNDVEGFLALMEEGLIDQAAALIVEENPLPSVCGRVCFHPCETACNRGNFDRPIAIHAMERYAGDWARVHGTEISKRPATGKTVHVIGAGPAGLAAAFHLARLGHAVTVFEAQPEAGGILRYGIPAYRLPTEVLASEIARVQDLDVEIKTKVRIGSDISFEDVAKADAVFVSIGAYRSFALKVPGEELAKVYSGLRFLESVARGDRMDLGGRVAVIGDGNTAIDAARSARRLGNKVTIFSLTEQHEMPAFADEIVEALREGVELSASVMVREIHGQDGEAVGLTLDRVTLEEPDATGWRTPHPIEGSWLKADATAVIVAIGQTGDLAFLPEKLPVKNGHLQPDPSGRLGGSHVFTGGDCSVGPNTVAHAIGDGKRAAVAIDRFLAGQEAQVPAEASVGADGAPSMSRYRGDGAAHSRNERFHHVVAFKELNLNYFHEVPRVPLAHRPVNKRLDNFQEIVSTISEEGMAAESRRCFHCGVCTECDNCYVFCPDVAIAPRDDAFGYDINFDYCKGCGVCVHECPRNAMAMAKE